MSQRPAPYTIALCSLIVLHYEGVAAKEQRDQQKQPKPGQPMPRQKISPLYQAYDDASESDTAAKNHPRVQVEAFLQEELQTVQFNPNAPIRDLIQKFRRKMADGNAPVVALFLKWLSAASTSMDAMMDLITSLQLSVTSANPIVDATSVSGMFIRSVCCLGFPQLSFTETCRLWKQFLAQTEQAQDSLNNLKREDNGPDSGEIVEPWSLSPGQMEHLLRQECELLGLPGNVVREGMDSLQLSASDMPSAHFLRYLKCLQSKERVGAMDALHAYFDHVLIQSQTTKQHQQKDHLQILQFAAILLAALHLETGDVALARLATDEAVRVAQQSPETGAGCVAYSLGWLSQTATAAAAGGNDDGAREWMARCVDRSLEEKNLRSLVAGANLARVRHALLDQVPNSALWGGSSSLSRSALTLPQVAWNFLFAAATVDGSDAGASTTHHFIPPSDRPIHITDTVAGKSALQVMCQQRLMGSAIWDAYNQSSSSGIFSYLALFIHGGNKDVLRANHAVSAIKNMARTALYGSSQPFLLQGTTKASEMMDDEDSKEPSEKSRHDESCIYGVALQQMNLLREAFGLPLEVEFSQEMALICHEWSVRRGDFNEAQGWMRYLISNLSPGINNHTQLELDVRIQQSLLLQAQERWDEAKQILQSILAQGKNAGQPLYTALILLRLALLLLDSSSSSVKKRRNQSYSNALPYLMECLTICDEHRQDGLHATAMTILAQLHLRMNRIDPAIAMIEAALPNLLQKGHIWFQGDAFLTKAKCHLQKKSRGKLGVRALNMAMQSLAESEKLFLRCQDGKKLAQVWFLQAKIYNEMGNEAKRNKASQKFVKIRKYLGQAASPYLDRFDPSFSDYDSLYELIHRDYVQ